MCRCKHRRARETNYLRGFIQFATVVVAACGVAMYVVS